MKILASTVMAMILVGLILWLAFYHPESLFVCMFILALFTVTGIVAVAIHLLIFGDK